MKTNHSKKYRGDLDLLNKAIAKHSVAGYTLRLLISLVILVIWIMIVMFIHHIGSLWVWQQLVPPNSPSWIHELTTFADSINTYLWWALIIITTLIVYSIWSGWWSASIHRFENKPCSQDFLVPLAHQLSDSGKSTLLWAWEDRREPITLAILRLAAHELKQGRAETIEQIREMEYLLSKSSSTPLTITGESLDKR